MNYCRPVLIIIINFIATTTSASDTCTIVQNVRVMEGGTAELLCQINHERNDPSKTKFYRKTWSMLRKQPDAVEISRQVYVYIRQGDTVLQDKANVVTDSHTGRVVIDYRGRAVRTSNDVVKLRNVTLQDDALYTCTWEVEQGIPGCLDAKAGFSLTVIVPVSGVKATAESPRKEGDNTQFTCSVSGPAPITYTWQKVGGAIPTDRWTDHGDGSATLRNIQRADAGQYRCTADNEANKPQSSDAVKLDVHYAPRLNTNVDHKPDVIGAFNQTVTFVLQVLANPNPSYNWFRFYNNTEMPLLEKSVVKSEGLTSRLTIPSLGIDDANITYVCQAQNPIGRKNFSFALIVTDTLPAPGTSPHSETVSPVVVGYIVGPLIVVIIVITVIVVVVIIKRRSAPKKKKVPTATLR